MNISTRLEKLERASNVHSAFCSCPGEPQTRVIFPDFDETEQDRQRLIAEYERPKCCEVCGKPTYHRGIIVEYTDGEG